MGETLLMKTVVTPGRLYSMLRHEFDQRRHPDCASCHLPVPFCLATPLNGSNWLLGERFRDCERCDPLIAELVREYQAKYDLLDFSQAMPPGRPASSRPGFHGHA